jgi:hypothetical protein
MTSLGEGDAGSSRSHRSAFTLVGLGVPGISVLEGVHTAPAKFGRGVAGEKVPGGLRLLQDRVHVGEGEPAGKEVGVVSWTDLWLDVIPEVVVVGVAKDEQLSG